MNTTAFSVGDPILVVGRICSVKTCVGLFGYIKKIYTTEEAGGDESSPKIYIQLLNHPSFPKDDYLRKSYAEKHGRFDTWSAAAHAADLVPLTDAKALARVNALKAKEAEEEANEKPDPEWDARLKAMSLDESIAKWKKEKEEVKAESKRIGRVFTLPGCIKRGNKKDYPTFKDIRYINDELMNYAARGPSKCTLTERARWGQCLEAIESVSFWSGRKEVREVVKELDLDPMASEHESALYKNQGRVYAVNGTLRDAVIKLWNRGAIILYIQDMENEDTCWSDYKDEKGEPNGYLVSYAFRRKLPERKG